MELVDKSQPAKTLKTGRQAVVIPGGKSLKIETTPDGKEILNVIVPAGKTWSAIIIVEIIET